MSYITKVNLSTQSKNSGDISLSTLARIRNVQDPDLDQDVDTD